MWVNLNVRQTTTNHFKNFFVANYVDTEFESLQKIVVDVIAKEEDPADFWKNDGSIFWLPTKKLSWSE